MVAPTLIDGTGHRGETDYEFRLLGEYFHASEAAMPTAEDAANADLHEALSDLKAEDETTWAAMQFLAQAGKFRREFPLRMRYGFLVQLYTLFEDRARSLAKTIANRDGLEVPSLRDRSHIGFVFVFRDWLSGNTDAESSHWNGVDQFRVIRNCVAHSNGRVDGDRNPKGLRNTIACIEGIEEDEFGYLGITKEFCESIFEMVISLFDNIYSTTRFGSSFFLAHRMPSHIGILIERDSDGCSYRVLDSDDEP